MTVLLVNHDELVKFGRSQSLSGGRAGAAGVDWVSTA